MTYALSGSALTVAALESYSIITWLETIPEWTGVTLAGSIIAASFAYAFARQNKRIGIFHEHRHLDEQNHEHKHEYEHDVDEDRREKDRT